MRDKDKNILFVIGNYEYGGVMTVVKQYSMILSKKYNVIVLGWQGNIEDPEKFFSESEVFVIGRSERANLIGRLQDFAPFTKKLNVILHDSNIDLIHYHLTWTALYTLVHPKVWWIKKIVTFHGAYDLEAKDYVGGNLVSTLTTVIVRKFLQDASLRFADRIFVLSDYSKNLLTNHFSEKLKKKIKLIPGFIN